MDMPRDNWARRRAFGRFALLLLGLVAYGSLLPFHYNGLSLGEGLARFAAIPLLEFRAIGRADWVANILLYLPLGFALAGWLTVRRPYGAFQLPRYLAALLICAVTAVSIEFLQAFFPPRTQSINDLITELLGSGLGILVWAQGRKIGRAHV
jgi:VanZ family protein